MTLRILDASVKGAIVYLYEKLYHQNIPSRPILEGTSYNTICIDYAKALWKAINNLGRRQDDFNIAFLQYCQILDAA